MTKTILVISDMHVGSEYGICTPTMNTTMIDSAEKTLHYNTGQKYLYDNWVEIAKKWKKPDILVLLGDILDAAVFRNEDSAYCWTKNMADQLTVVEELLDMFKPKRTYVIRGTPAHVMVQGTHIEELMAQRLNAVKSNVSHARSRLRWMPKLKGSNVRFDFAHHVGVSKTFHYMSTPITKEVMNALLHAETGAAPRVVVRGHAHYYWHVESANHDGFISSCWQLSTPFGAKLSPGASSTGLGMIRFHVGKGDEWSYEKWMVKHPPPELDDI